MDLNRNSTATAAEKKTFTIFAQLIAIVLTLIGCKVDHRELKGKSRPKFVFALKPNNVLIHTLEFQMAGDIVKRIILVVSRVTLDSPFYKGLMKLPEVKNGYGGVSVFIPIEAQSEEANRKEVEALLLKIGKLAENHEELELDPKRTYHDPPQGWVEGAITRPVKKDEPKAEAKDKSKAKAKAKPKAEETPKAEATTEAESTPSAEAVAEAAAKEDIKADA